MFWADPFGGRLFFLCDEFCRCLKIPLFNNVNIRDTDQL